MTKVRQLLDEKGRDVWSVGSDTSVFDAISEMARRDVGALIVSKGGNPVGIFTERHYARNVFLKGRASPDTPVGEVMTSRIICVRPENTVEECMAVMTKERVRHLPVLSEERLVGIVSIGDLVKSVIADQKFAIEQLEQFIRG